MSQHDVDLDMIIRRPCRRQHSKTPLILIDMESSFLSQWSLFYSDVLFNELTLLSLKIRRIAQPVGKLRDRKDFNRLRDCIHVRYTTLHRALREILTVASNCKRQQDLRSAKVTRIFLFENESLL